MTAINIFVFAENVEDGSKGGQMNLDLIKIKKIGNEFYGTFRWNDFDTGRFSYVFKD